jgi:hypothetical protein
LGTVSPNFVRGKVKVMRLLPDPEKPTAERLRRATRDDSGPIDFNGTAFRAVLKAWSVVIALFSRL